MDAGTIDCVVVYKVDRLSRSLLDFARLIERFDRRGVSFVSVTQEFNTTSSLGRLTLNILLSFAQFEREIISERTRDKLSAARRKGKWIGGWPVLGYDVDPKGGRLVVNAKEAEQVREVYRIAAETESLEATLRAIAGRFRTKAWKSRSGKRHQARSFSRMTLRLLLSNVIYTGSVNHKGTVYPGEHERIVEQEAWDRVNGQLADRSNHQRGRGRRRQEGLLTGLLFCRTCGGAMTLTFTTKNGHRYRYYSCAGAKNGEESRCAQPPIAAVDLEESIRKNIAPNLGAGLNSTTLREGVSRVEYDGTTRRIAIELREGTRLDYELSWPNRRGARSPKPIDTARVPRVSRLMALAIKFERQIREGEIANYRDVAVAGRVSRARLSQIMRLADLAPRIQEELLFLPSRVAGRDVITEKALRQVSRSIDWDWQLEQWAKLKARIQL
jgi:site-specific DNA recombinase